MSWQRKKKKGKESPKLTWWAPCFLPFQFQSPLHLHSLGLPYLFCNSAHTTSFASQKFKTTTINSLLKLQAPVLGNPLLLTTYRLLNKHHITIALSSRSNFFCYLLVDWSHQRPMLSFLLLLLGLLSIIFSLCNFWDTPNVLL